MKERKPINFIRATIPAKSANEAFSRSLICSFASQLDPTVEELCDIKTAVSEAVTNCIVHAYRETIGKIYITAQLFADNTVCIKIRDKGCGIDDVKQAMEPLFTTAGGERAGLGFAVMQSFMDGMRVTSTPGKGTTVTLKKKISLRVKADA